MKTVGQFVTGALVSGFLIALPAYLAILLLLKAMQSVVRLLRPLAALLPPGAMTPAAENGLALLAVLAFCFALGLVVRTRLGRAAKERFERSVLVKIPGYVLVQNLTQQLTGQGHEHVWKPALVEMEDGLVAAFIIEEIGDDQYVVFVPSVPSPVTGSTYVFRRERVHPVSASFVQTVHALSRWGSGLGALVAAMESGSNTSPKSTQTKIA